MSTEHLTTEILQAYVARTLGPEDLLRADGHLQKCDRCHGSITELKPMQEAAAVILSGACKAQADLDMHLSYEQMEAYVDGTIDDVAHEIADVHTASCSFCLDQLNDLRELKESIGRQTDERPSSATHVSFWDKISAALTIRMVVAAGALVILGVGLWGISTLILNEPGPIETVVVEDTVPVVESQTGQSSNNDPDVAAANGEANSAPRPVILLVDGRSRIELGEDGNLSGIDAGRFEARLKAVLTKEDVQVAPVARELRSTSGVLMGGGSPGAPFGLTAPVGRVILSDQPRFSWRPLADAESYFVTVFDENFTKVAESPALKQASWTVDKRLKRGSVYNWQVTAIKAGQEIKSPVRPAPDAKFKVIDAAAANEIEAARRTGSHLVLGTLYANAGMIAEAERELQILVKQNPRSELARKLLRKVQASK